ncbi:MAG: CinA family protein, partial [Planctomycetaceae bacterium]|nr:CinA family protein [Planctomycetaceae bacterium]
RIVEVPNADQVCRGGLVLTSQSDGEHLLGLVSTPSELNSSEAGTELARRMAVTTRSRFHATYGIAVTPWGSVPLENGQPPVPTAWVAVADAAGRVWSAECRQTGNPAIFAPRTAKTALDLLRRQLLGLPEPGGM